MFLKTSLNLKCFSCSNEIVSSKKYPTDGHLTSLPLLDEEFLLEAIPYSSCFNYPFVNPDCSFNPHFPESGIIIGYNLDLSIESKSSLEEYKTEDLRNSLYYNFVILLY